jgi:Raf kinase inhibitor-like YbhB/YbcL family protein
MLELRSQEFEHGAEIPARFTCDGKNISPPLIWAGLPDGTKSLALIVDDPDVPDPKAPTREWVHWLLYNIPAGVRSLAEAMQEISLPEGTLAGRNDWGKAGYGGPCPPIGRHRYFHKLYALDTVLPDLSLPDKGQLLEAMDGHVLGECELVGTYCRKRCSD